MLSWMNWMHYQDVNGHFSAKSVSRYRYRTYELNAVIMTKTVTSVPNQSLQCQISLKIPIQYLWTECSYNDKNGHFNVKSISRSEGKKMQDNHFSVNCTARYWHWTEGKNDGSLSLQFSCKICYRWTESKHDWDDHFNTNSIAGYWCR